MTAQWYLLRQSQGQPSGPMPAEKLLALAASGGASAGDWVWMEGMDVQITVERFLAIARMGQLPDSPDKFRPEWLADVARNEIIERSREEPNPDWLEEMRHANKSSPKAAPRPAAPGKPSADPSTNKEFPVDWLEDVRQGQKPRIGSPKPAPPPAAPSGQTSITDEFVIKGLPDDWLEDIQQIEEWLSAQALPLPAQSPASESPKAPSPLVANVPPRPQAPATTPASLPTGPKAPALTPPSGPPSVSPRPQAPAAAPPQVPTVSPRPQVPAAAPQRPQVPTVPPQPQPPTAAPSGPNVPPRPQVPAAAPQVPTVPPRPQAPAAVPPPPSITAEQRGFDPTTGRILNTVLYNRWQKTDGQRRQEELRRQRTILVADAFVNAQRAIQEWVDADANKPLVVSGDLEAIYGTASLREILRGFEVYGPLMQDKVRKRLAFLVENRRKFYKAFQEKT